MPISYPEVLRDSGCYLAPGSARRIGFAKPHYACRPGLWRSHVDRPIHEAARSHIGWWQPGRLIKIAAADPDGCFHGIQTLLQILKSGQAKVEIRQVSFPGAKVYDYPESPGGG